MIDATGLVVAPGLVDLSARLREPGLEYKATLESEMLAAVAGGVTSLACPPDTDPPLDEPGLVEMLTRRASSLNLARVYPVGALTAKLEGERLTEMAELRDHGCIAFSQAEVPLADTQILWRALQYAATFGLAVWLRPQDPHLAEGGVAHDGEVATRLGLPGIPAFAETIALGAILQLVRVTGTRVHLCRLSARESVEMIRAAKREGLPVTCDVSAHHLHLSELDLGYFDSHCHVVPPFRSQRDREALERGARRRHDRRGLLGPHAGRRGREAAAVRRVRAGHDRARAAAAAHPEVEPRSAPAARAGARAGDLRPGAHPRHRCRASRRRRAGGRLHLRSRRPTSPSRLPACAARARTRRSSATSCRAWCAGRWWRARCGSSGASPLQSVAASRAGSHSPAHDHSLFAHRARQLATAIRASGTQLYRDERDQGVVRAPFERGGRDPELVAARQCSPATSQTFRAGSGRAARASSRPAFAAPRAPASATREQRARHAVEHDQQDLGEDDDEQRRQVDRPIGGMKRRKKP